MIYIHKLKDLNPKAAEIESVEILRSLKKESFFPLSPEKFESQITPFFLSETDRTLMSKAFELLTPVIEEVLKIAKAKDPIYEPVNIKRALEMLKDVQAPLSKNIMYAEKMSRVKLRLIREFVGTINTIPDLKKQEDKIKYNAKLNSIFEEVLRNKEMFFNSEELVDDGEVEKIRSLHESMTKGFLIHISLEEEIKKKTYDQIKARIPEEKLKQLDAITESLGHIEKGIQRAYDNNLRMIDLAVLMYSYIKLAMEKK